MTAVATLGERLAQAASDLIGTRFRLHGRDPEHGLDCVGLVHASLLAIDRIPVSPMGYRLRNSDHRRWVTFAKHSGLLPVVDQVQAGDVMLVEPGPGQHHLIIVESSNTGIHAHAALGRVVRQPMEFVSESLAHWRLY